MTRYMDEVTPEGNQKYEHERNRDDVIEGYRRGVAAVALHFGIEVEVCDAIYKGSI